jgi:hypothetical protein
METKKAQFRYCAADQHSATRGVVNLREKADDVVLLHIHDLLRDRDRVTIARLVDESDDEIRMKRMT